MKRSTIKLAGLVAVGLIIGGAAAAVTETQTAKTSSISPVSELPLVGSIGGTGISKLVPALPDSGLPTAGLVNVPTGPSTAGKPAPAVPKLELPIASDLPVATSVAGVSPTDPTGILDQLTNALPTGGLTEGLPTGQLLDMQGLLGGLPLNATGLLGE